MKTDKERKEMVARVQAVYAKYQTFESLPIVGTVASEVPLKEHETGVLLNAENSDYVRELYEACSRGSVVARGPDRNLYYA